MQRETGFALCTYTETMSFVDIWNDISHGDETISFGYVRGSREKWQTEEEEKCREIIIILHFYY